MVFFFQTWNEVSFWFHDKLIKTNNEIFWWNSFQLTTYFELEATLVSSFLSPEHCPTPLRYQTSIGFLDPQERAPFASLYGDGHSFFLRASHDWSSLVPTQGGLWVNARELSGRAWDFNRTNGYQDRTNAEFGLSQTARCYLLIRAILQEINGEKRPEKTKDYFIVSNSTIFEINVTFI